MCGDDSGKPVSLPEWSKGLRSGRNVFERVGSNPTADKSFAAAHNKMLQRLLTRSLTYLFTVFCWAYHAHKAQTQSRLLVRRRSTRQTAQHLLGTLPTIVAACVIVASIKRSR